MSKIESCGLGQYGTDPFEQQQFGTAGVEGVKQLYFFTYLSCLYRLATDDTYTIDEVSEMLDSLESVVRAEIESELIYTAHTNVLLINQILRQAETQQVSVDVDVFKLEDR